MQTFKILFFFIKFFCFILEFIEKSNYHDNNNLGQDYLYTDEHNNITCKICKKCLKMKNLAKETNRHGIGICDKNNQPEKVGKKKKK